MTLPTSRETSLECYNYWGMLRHVMKKNSYKLLILGSLIIFTIGYLAASYNRSSPDNKEPKSAPIILEATPLATPAEPSINEYNDCVGSVKLERKTRDSDIETSFAEAIEKYKNDPQRTIDEKQIAVYKNEIEKLKTDREKYTNVQRTTKLLNNDSIIRSIDDQIRSMEKLIAQLESMPDAKVINFGAAMTDELKESEALYQRELDRCAMLHGAK